MSLRVLGILNHLVLADLKRAFIVTEVHAVAQTVSPHLASLAGSRLHPLAVSVQFITMLPNLPEMVVIDVALVVVATDAEAARDGTVGEDGSDVDSCAA